MGLYRLLAELHERVLENLSSTRDLGRAACVCRAWRAGDSPVERVLRRRIKARGGAVSAALPPVAVGSLTRLATTGASDVLADADAVLRADSIASFVDNDEFLSRSIAAVIVASGNTPTDRDSPLTRCSTISYPCTATSSSV